jgi:MFS family permease
VQIVYFTLVAAILYLLSNWLVDRIEIAAGRRFQYRSLLFFALLLALAMISFSLIGIYTGKP